LKLEQFDKLQKRDKLEEIIVIGITKLSQNEIKKKKKKKNLRNK